MRRVAAIVLILLAGCGRPAAPVTPELRGAGAVLEAAAVRRGLVADSATVDPVGSYAGDTDRVCIAPADEGYWIGAAVDYGEGQGCVARGTAIGRATLDVRLGEACRFEATIDGDRIAFPPVLPATCDRACTGRASLAALTATRLSHSATEARSATTAAGKPLCP